MATTFNLELSAETLALICRQTENHELYREVARVMAGQALGDFTKIIPEWSQHWPVIDTNLRLTGGATDGEDRFSNYNDEAMVDTEDALAAGWTMEDGYASPPDDLTDA